MQNIWLTVLKKYFESPVQPSINIVMRQMANPSV